MSVRIISGLREVADSYDGFILDLWGVIHDGLAPYPQARETLIHLREKGKRTVLLSNAPRRLKRLIRDLADIGIERELYSEIMSSGEATRRGLTHRVETDFAALGKKCLLVGLPQDIDLLEELDLIPVSDVNDADFLLVTGPREREATLEDHHELFEAALARNLPLVCANPDLIVVGGDQLLLCAGALAREYRTRGGASILRGKPDPAIYHTCLELMGTHDRTRIMAVGDAFATDITGADAFGIDSLLVAGGIHAEEFGSQNGEPPTAERAQEVIAAHGRLEPTAIIGRFTW